MLHSHEAAARVCEACGGWLREAGKRPEYWADRKTAAAFRAGYRGVIDTIGEVVILKIRKDVLAPDQPAARAMAEVAASLQDQIPAMRGVYDTAYQATGPIGYIRSAAEWKLKVDFNHENEWAKLWFQTYAFEASDATMARVAGDITGMIRQANARGLSIPNTVDLLKSGFVNMKTYQLETVALTELHTANQAGVHLSFLDAKVEYNMWISQPQDPRTRRRPRDDADHVVMNGEVTRVGEKFSNGLVFPGDKAGRIAEWIRCRCRKRPWIPPAGWTPRATPFKT